MGAIAGNAKVGNRMNIVTRWQALEYITSQNMDRRAFASLNCITVVPGAVGAWRKDLLEQAGGFPSDTLAEDQDLTLQIRRLGYKIGYEETAIAWTEAPDHLKTSGETKISLGVRNVAVHVEASRCAVSSALRNARVRRDAERLDLSNPVSVDLAGDGSDVDLHAGFDSVWIAGNNPPVIHRQIFSRYFSTTPCFWRSIGCRRASRSCLREKNAGVCCGGCSCSDSVIDR